MPFEELSDVHLILGWRGKRRLEATVESMNQLGTFPQNRPRTVRIEFRRGDGEDIDCPVSVVGEALDRT